MNICSSMSIQQASRRFEERSILYRSSGTSLTQDFSTTCINRVDLWTPSLFWLYKGKSLEAWTAWSRRNISRSYATTQECAVFSLRLRSADLWASLTLAERTSFISSNLGSEPLTMVSRNTLDLGRLRIGVATSNMPASRFLSVLATFWSRLTSLTSFAIFLMSFETFPMTFYASY